MDTKVQKPLSFFVQDSLTAFGGVVRGIGHFFFSVCFHQFAPLPFQSSFRLSCRLLTGAQLAPGSWSTHACGNQTHPSFAKPSRGSVIVETSSPLLSAPTNAYTVNWCFSQNLVARDAV